MDRNAAIRLAVLAYYQSLSARRAWIEIAAIRLAVLAYYQVALRKESVDRNGLGICHYRDDVSSLSARRAWIEIVDFHLFASSGVVALRKESVDRNTEDWLDAGSLSRRSPQGERG